MKVFRFFLVAILATMLVYTTIVGSTHGWNFVPVFLGDICAMNWAGQFNLDFSFFLIITGLWIAWRNKFSAAGLGLGAFTLVGGIPFVSTYLLILSFKGDGSLKQILLGKNENN